jgi:hypothetical protein
MGTTRTVLRWRRLRVHKQTQPMLYLIDLRLNTGTAEHRTNASFSSCSGDSPDLLFLSRRPNTLGGMYRRDEDRC